MESVEIERFYGLELDSVPQITVTDLADIMRSEPGQVTVLDVREPAEAETGAIENSIQIPLGKLKSRTNQQAAHT